jgi:hypothetical protein
MSSSRKKTIIRKISREWVQGYVSSSGFTHQGKLELLDLSGKVLLISNEEIKWVCFVRDFNSGEYENPERLLRKTFSGRPRSEGVWLRLQLRDGDAIEGLAENNIGLVDSDGIFITPPDTRGNTQRLWIPRTSLAELEIVAVVGNTTRKKPARSESTEAARQETLFPYARS